METITITVEQIKSNSSLDLTDRLNFYSKNNNLPKDDLEDLCIASIKQEYEYWANKRTNISERTDAMLTQILNGHSLNRAEAFEMICDDPAKVQEFTKYADLEERISRSNGITQEDFDELCITIGIDAQTKGQIEQEFKNRGLMIESYIEEESKHK